jgi:hypothetical protein
VKRNLLVIFGTLAALSALFYYMIVSSVQVECAVVMNFKGREATVRASGATHEDARRTAVTGACGQISSGMSELIECENTPPRSEQCS